MKISTIKNHLASLHEIAFELPNGELVPRHFHVTEVGMINKNFIDCGGVVRHEEKASLQLWEADDYDHRLNPGKLMDIIELSEKVLNMDDLEIEVEYQSDTIGKYDLDFDGKNFKLVSKFTDCLAKDNCGIPEKKEKLSMADLNNNTCTPGSGCC